MQTENQANLEEKLTWLQCCKVHRGAEGVGIEGKAPGVVKTVDHLPGLYGVRRQAKRDAALA